MKKLATITALLAGVGLAFSQGTVNFNNNGVSVGGDHDVYFLTVGGAKVSGTNLVAEILYTDPATQSLTPIASSISKFRVTSTLSPGTWSGKTIAIPAGGPNVPLVVDVVVWDSTLYATYAAAKGNPGWSGESGPFTYTEQANVPAGTTDKQLITLPAFALQNVPEPSAIALSVMGIAGLLFLRRRK